MKLDFPELERGFKEELLKMAAFDAPDKAPQQGPQPTGFQLQNPFKGFFDPVKNTWSQLKNLGNAAMTVPRAAAAFGGKASEVGGDIIDTVKGGWNLYQAGKSAIKAIPQLVDNIGKMAPLALGAIALAGNRNQGQAGAGQPVVVNNYMGQKSNMLTPTQGVNTLEGYKAGSLKTADLVTKALADAAKRRMANKVLDTVSPETQTEKPEVSPEELEVTTKYPQIAKILEDEQNKAYLSRLLSH